MDSRRARILLAVCVLLATLFSGCGTKAVPPTPPSEAETKNRCPLDGTVLYHQSDVTRRSLAAIIDNDPVAWPVSGLSRACLVYEVPVEGGMTRFIALYHHQDAALTGPIRSARSYFLPLIQENDAILAHVGGSDSALAGIGTVGLDHFDELVSTTPFWQGANRQRPHATFTNTDQMRTAAVQAGMRGTGSEAPFATFGEDDAFSVATAVQGAAAPKAAATIAFGGGPQAVSYRYDQTDGTYHRYIGDITQKDGATTGGINPETVIVLFLSKKAGNADPEGTVSFIGQGRALFFSGGVGTTGSWRKNSAGARTGLFDSAGKPIVLRPGQVWVHFIYADATVTPDLSK